MLLKAGREGKMRTRNGKRLESTLIAIGIAVFMILLAGCGGGGGGQTVAQLPQFTAESTDQRETVDEQEIYYDLDLDIEGDEAVGRAAFLDSSTVISDINALSDKIVAMPDSYFARSAGRKNSSNANRNLKRLDNIIKNIERDIQRGMFRTAYKRIERKLIPRVDGCNGGRSKDDYISGCSDKQPIYEAAVEVAEVIAGVMNGTVKPGKLSQFKKEIVAMLESIRGKIEEIANGGSSGSASETRALLIESLNLAANYVVDGFYSNMRDELNSNFIPCVDGINGDDLIVNATARREVYDDASAIVQDTTITGIAITPATLTIAMFGEQMFTATCGYASGYSEDCSSSVTWSVSEPALGYVYPTGLFTAGNVMTGTIWAETDGVKSNLATVTVTSN